MSRELQKSSGNFVQSYDNTPNWEQYAIGAAIALGVIATGGAIGYAIVTYGATLTTVSATGSTTILAIGKAISGGRG